MKSTSLCLLFSALCLSACVTSVSDVEPVFVGQPTAEQIESIKIATDTNKDQKLSLQELLVNPMQPGHLLYSTALYSPKAQWEAKAKEIIASMDVNKDGELGFDEMSGTAQYTKMFESYDKNKDGFLTLDELGAEQSPQGTLDTLDKNKDQKVSLEEFLNPVRMEQSRG